MSLKRTAGHQNRINRVLTDIGLVLGEHSHCVIIKGLTHELLGDLASAKTVKPLGHVDCGTLANIEYVAEELLELGVNDGSVDGQDTRGNLGRKRLASADEAVAEGRGCGELWVSLQVKPTNLSRDLLPTVQIPEDA